MPPGRLARSARWMGEQAAFLLVAAGIVAGLLVLLFSADHWGPGTATIAVSTLVAALLRLVLPPGRAGLLVIRSRWLDAAVFLVLGGVILGVDIRLHR